MLDYDLPKLARPPNHPSPYRLRLPEPYVYIAASAGGRLTPEALLRSQGTVEVRLFEKAFPADPRLIFRVAGEGFWFNLGFVNGRLVLQRSGHGVAISPRFFRKLPSNDCVLASWTPTQLTLLLGHIGMVGPSIREFVVTPPCLAPPSLLQWARRESLLPIVEYDSEGQFVERVHSGLAMIQDKIDETLTRQMFWDIQYDVNRIVRRTPKRETDIHGVIHALLSDQFFMSSIDILPEAATSAGRIDFLFTGVVRGKGLVKVCAEFKVRHSHDLVHGIENQLPAYMRAQHTRNGTYCILDFSGSWFESHRHQCVDPSTELARAARRGWPDLKYPIKIHHFSLADGVSASARSAQ